MCAFSSTKVKCVPSVRGVSDVCLQFEAYQMCAFSSIRIRCVPSVRGVHPKNRFFQRSFELKALIPRESTMLIDAKNAYNHN